MAAIVLKNPEGGRKENGLLFSAEEWKAVTDKLGEKKRNRTEVTERREDLMARKALSDGMRKTWTDTMEYREKRRKERLAKEAKAADDKREKMRKELEVETATTRRELMDKFDEKLFLNADGPKSLHSAYRCAEAVRQRSIQLQFAKHVNDVEAERQRAYDESKIQDAEKFKKEEEEKQKIKYEKEKKCKEEMWKTYKDNEERKAREAEEKKKRDHEDLENMKKEIEQIKANEKAETERKQRIARENVAENKKMFEHNMKVRREEELEEATATQYVLEMKRKIAAVRKQKEIEAQAERLARRDRNIAVAMVETADREKEEEERRKRAQEEKEQKYQKEELAKKEHQKRLADEIKKQQGEYVENESKKKREEHEKRKWEIMQLHKKIEINEEFEEEAKRNKYTKTADFKDIWSKQMEENRAKIETERMIERNMAANVAKSVEEFDARFFTYANKLIEESNARGRPTLPLEKLVQDYKFTTGKLKAPRPVGKEGWEEDSEEENTNVPSQIFNEVCGESYFSTTEASPLLLLGNEEWLEKPSLGGFRLWHLIFMVIASLLVTAICLCCCIRFRIPRTKQEIEADYVRKRITRKFQKQLQLIQNSEMDEMDLKKALDRIRAEFRSDTESIAQSEAFSVASVGSSGLPMSPTDDEDNRRKSSEIGVDIENLIERRSSSLGSRFKRIACAIGWTRARGAIQNPSRGSEV